MRLFLNILGFMFLAMGFIVVLNVMVRADPLSRDQTVISWCTCKFLLAIYWTLLAVCIFLLSCWI